MSLKREQTEMARERPLMTGDDPCDVEEISDFALNIVKKHR